MFTHAVVLGGGKGKRARRMYGKYTPKPLMEILGVRPLDLVVSLLQRCPEINDIRITLEYLSNTMIEYIEKVYVKRGLKGVYMMVNEGTPYGGTLGALESYINVQERKRKFSDEQNIIVLSADHLYGMDYSKFIQFHEENNSDITVAVQSIPSDQAYRFGVLNMEENVINSFIEKPKEKLDVPNCLISMGIYIFRISALKKIIKNNLPGKDIGKDAIPFALQLRNIKVCGYRYENFWIDVGEELGVWEAAFASRNDILEIKRLVHNQYVQMAADPWPAEICKPTQGVCRVGSGSIIEGSIKDSIVASGCYIGPDVKVDKCVIFKNSILTGKTAIKNTLIGSGVCGTDFEFGINPKKDIEDYPNYFYDEEGRPYAYKGKFGFIPAGESISVSKSYDELHKQVFGY